jgi:predicted amidohydrolase
MGLQGVELIVLGYNTPVHNPAMPETDDLGNFHNRLSMQAGAYANGTWVVGVAKAGVEEGVDQIGQSCVIAPSGEVVLRYRRLNSMFAPTPHDVWARYLDIYGIDGVFPVAQTVIGNLAAIASEEILYPEIARAHALRGAEVFVHSSSEIGSPIATPKMIAKRARAFENMAYVVSANTAGIGGTSGPLASADGNSMIVDWKGTVLAESNPGETFTAFAEIDLAALRAARRKPGMTNVLSRQRTELFACSYATPSHQHANSLIDGEELIIPDRDHFRRISEQTIARLAKDGLI